MLNKIKYYILEGTYEIKFISSFRRFKGIPIKGFIEPDTDTILINNNMSDSEKIITIIHEFLHEIKPNWSENQVEKKSLQLFRSMTSPDQLFFKKILKN